MADSSHPDIEPPVEPVKTANADLDKVLDEVSQRLSMLEATSDAAGLSAEAEYKALLKKEIQQRIDVRNWVIVIAIVVLIFMGGMLTHTAHSIYRTHQFDLAPSVLIALYLAPIVSITTITVMLLFGAFRRFKDDDMDRVSSLSLAAEVAKSTLGS
ncbi:hypothetical protein [Shinella sp.]|uniref:hypothetical protein n=1 Tax=Shinella sp. TaxID=1870904 RepID=UPI0029B30E4D|nr:hypothetical protein [Shinella sp.]MDX3976139.1 hypothetical protein [Shinella sp.]